MKDRTTFVETVAGRVEVYADSRIYVYDMLLAGEPLFDRDLHARMLLRDEFTKEQWLKLSAVERETTLSYELALARARIEKLQEEGKTKSRTIVGILLTAAAIWTASRFY